MPMRDELIQRAIQQLAVTFARLLGRTDAIGSVEASALRSEMEALYPAFLGTSAALLRRLGTEDILGVLRTAGYVDGERAYLLGALFEAEAELVLAELEAATATGTLDADAGTAAAAEAAYLRLRALDLVLEAGIEELGERDIPERVERLRRAVADEPRAPESWQRLHHYLAASGVHAKAEDALFQWLEALADAAGPERAGTAGDDRWRALRDTGSAFYSGLAARSDSDLEAGGLPRDEVEEGRGAFEERVAALS